VDAAALARDGPREGGGEMLVGASPDPLPPSSNSRVGVEETLKGSAPQRGQTDTSGGRAVAQRGQAFMGSGF